MNLRSNIRVCRKTNPPCLSTSVFSASLSFSNVPVKRTWQPVSADRFSFGIVIAFIFSCFARASAREKLAIDESSVLLDCFLSETDVLLTQKLPGSLCRAWPRSWYQQRLSLWTIRPSSSILQVLRLRRLPLLEVRHLRTMHPSSIARSMVRQPVHS